MAINKLKDLGNLNYSKNFIEEKNGLYPIYATSGIVGYTNHPTFEEESIILPRVGSFNIFFSNKKHSTKNTAFSFSVNTEKTIAKFIYFKLIKLNIINENMGSAVPRLTSDFWNELKINIPSLIIQQKIIDIIEPNEKLFLKYSDCVQIENFQNTKNDMKNLIDIIEPLEAIKINLLKQLESISKYANLITVKNSIIGKMNEKCQFLKGESVDNFSKGKTLFLNVAAANGNPNKYCDNDPNILPGDVTLSLDGNTGLVNNNLLGFNGYLYNVKSKEISSWLIYYSLKHKINQNIINLNETGTTIKHSANSKKELLLLKFECGKILENLFTLEINLKKQITLINILIKEMISLLIK